MKVIKGCVLKLSPIYNIFNTILQTHTRREKNNLTASFQPKNKTVKEGFINKNDIQKDFFLSVPIRNCIPNHQHECIYFRLLIIRLNLYYGGLMMQYKTLNLERMTRCKFKMDILIHQCSE